MVSYSYKRSPANKHTEINFKQKQTSLATQLNLISELSELLELLELLEPLKRSAVCVAVETRAQLEGKQSTVAALIKFTVCPERSSSLPVLFEASLSVESFKLNGFFTRTSVQQSRESSVCVSNPSRLLNKLI